MEGWPNFYWCSLCLHVNLGYCIVFFHLKLKESVILFFAYWEMSEILLHILLLPRSALYYIGSMASCKDWNTFGPERLLCFIFWRVIFLGIEFLAEIFRFRTYIPTTVLISIVLNEKSVVSLIAEPMYCDRWLLNCCFQSILMVFFKKKIIFFVVLGLHCCTWAFSSCSKRGLLFGVVCELPITVASSVAEHRLWVHRL